ncbi:MAG TPA: hydrogenase maturation protease [Candidatus Acidoferrum sp.]|nr:hydrogenase maturation protease [Candidatus Acidoferrum sp.]
MPKTEGNVLVIGIGNELRGDDAAGIVVARRIQERHLPGLQVLEHNGEGASLMEAWTGAQSVFIVDAVISGSAPGTIHRFDATRQPLPSQAFQSSTHAFGLREAVEVARALNLLPARLVIYGIEGKSFAAGEEISAELAQAATRVSERVLEEARATDLAP